MLGSVLVLNQNFEPLNITSWRRAMAMILLGKALVIEEDSEWITTVTRVLRMPSVVRLNHLVRRPMPELKLSRRGILTRDNFTCQYCGRQSRSLTIDHVTPRERGGPHTWTNLVACCSDCNHRKGNRMPNDVGMSLLRQPERPRLIPYLNYSVFRAAVQHDQWRDYLKPFAPHLVED
jgi:5-methylcytosine-specific restriction endonuclease McrA